MGNRCCGHLVVSDEAQLPRLYRFRYRVGIARD